MATTRYIPLRFILFLVYILRLVAINREQSACAQDTQFFTILLLLWGLNIKDKLLLIGKTLRI